MRRVLIDCRNLAYPGSGLCAYCEGVIAELAAHEKDFNFVFLVENAESINRLHLPFKYTIMKSYFKKSNTLLRDLDEQILIPLRLLFKKIDVFHGFDFYVPSLPTKYKKVSTIHDCAAFRDLVNGSFRTKYRCMLQRMAVKAADKIVTISHFSKKEIVEIHKISEEKVVVTYNGIKELYYEPVDDKTKEVTLNKISSLGKYVLYYGGYRKNKNVGVLIDAFRKTIGYSLILTGSKKAIDALLKEKGIKDSRFVNWGFASDEEIKCLLDNCAAFVFPSAYEGFGLPVAEALSRGARVFCNDIDVLREVGQEDVDYFSDEASLAALIQNINEEVPSKKTKRIFRYNEAVEQITNIYKTI